MLVIIRKCVRSEISIKKLNKIASTKDKIGFIHINNFQTPFTAVILKGC